MICAIVLAAGRSERMGTQKLLLPLGGKPVITRIVDELLRSPVQQIIVVVGRDAVEIQSALTNRNVSFTKNPDPAGDMRSSIRRGLMALPIECEAILIVLGDQPKLTAQLVTVLINLMKASGCGVVLPEHGGHRGHPVLMASRFRHELLAPHDETGLRGLLDRHADEVKRVNIEDASVLEDMDTPEDYEKHSNSTNA